MTVSHPTREGTVILAFDVSNSMGADDLEPTRIEAAKRAARAFVEQQPSTIRIGVVAFGDGAVVVAAADQRHRRRARRDRPACRSAAARRSDRVSSPSLSAIAGKPLTIDEAALDSDVGEVDIGYFGSSAIVLLSDGENTRGPTRSTSPRSRRSPACTIHAIGIGTERGHGGRGRRLQRGHRARRGPADGDRRRSPTARTTQAADADGARRRSTSRIDLEFKTRDRSTPR